MHTLQYTWSYSYKLALHVHVHVPAFQRSAVDSDVRVYHNFQVALLQQQLCFIWSALWVQLLALTVGSDSLRRGTHWSSMCSAVIWRSGYTCLLFLVETRIHRCPEVHFGYFAAKNAAVSHEPVYALVKNSNRSRTIKLALPTCMTWTIIRMIVQNYIITLKSLSVWVCVAMEYMKSSDSCQKFIESKTLICWPIARPLRPLCSTTHCVL